MWLIKFSSSGSLKILNNVSNVCCYYISHWKSDMEHTQGKVYSKKVFFKWRSINFLEIQWDPIRSNDYGRNRKLCFFQGLCYWWPLTPWTPTGEKYNFYSYARYIIKKHRCHIVLTSGSLWLYLRGPSTPVILIGGL